MALGKNGPLQQYKWHFVAIYIALIITVLLVFFTTVFQSDEPGAIPQLVWLAISLVVMGAVIFILSKTFRILGTIQDNKAKLDNIAETLEKNRSVLTKINQSSRLSESAKAIAFRDTDIQTLREAVFDKLQQKDFDAAFELIEEIARRPEYGQLAEQLGVQATKYRDSTDAERENEIIAHIEKLFETCQWAKASALIERLVRDYPNSDKAKQMRQQLLDKKEERKKILLNAWDDAVKRQATDRSLEILRELDQYLSPNEGLALQEAARDVFRTKLHNLGVQFSLAVSGRLWDKAIETGGQIIRNFPNSRMAEEIREKWDVLKQKAAHKSS
ncbi:MAG: hypothetical protein JSV82_00560 [Planctomycetota bacterium]|nr:MAG: hypothetical protein JSV82_00560 [Planctomycetota bacterium]